MGTGSVPTFARAMPLNATSTLSDGTRVRVRLPYRADRLGLRELHLRLGLEADELVLARALRFDPRRRLVACLTAWEAGAERLVGYGAIVLGADVPDVLVVDVHSAPGADALLAGTLRDRAAARRAAA